MSKVAPVVRADAYRKLVIISVQRFEESRTALDI